MNTYTQSLRGHGAAARNDGPLAGLLRLFSRVRSGLVRRSEHRARRAAFLNLTHLDDRMLDDIGLDRVDVERAAALPLEINASLAIRRTSGGSHVTGRRVRRR